VRHQGIAASLMPANPYACHNYSLQLAEVGRREESYRWADRATVAAPDFGAAHLDCVRRLRQVGRPGQAFAEAQYRCREILDRAAAGKLPPNDWQAPHHAALLIHRHTRALATAGVSRWGGLDLVRGVGLDLYSVGWPADEAELRRAVSDLRLDRPLVLSAFPGAHPHRSIKTLLDDARCGGYGGAFVWSVLCHDSTSGYDGQVPQWALNHAGQLHRRELPPPAPPVSSEGGEETAEVPANAPLVLKR